MLLTNRDIGQTVRYGMQFSTQIHTFHELIRQVGFASSKKQLWWLSEVQNCCCATRVGK